MGLCKPDTARLDRDMCTRNATRGLSRSDVSIFEAQVPKKVNDKLLTVFGTNGCTNEELLLDGDSEDLEHSKNHYLVLSL